VAFWAASPNTEGGDVVTHWPTEDDAQLRYRQGESRCILIASGLGPRAHMYAHILPCDSKQASGLVTTAAAAAPPPPPGVHTPHYYDPVRAPPPPPSLKRAALEVYVRKEVRPRVVAICQGGLEGAQHQTICMAIAESLGKYQPIAGYGMVSPFCEKVCWHSCHGDSHAGGMEDGFASCPSEGCAQDSCLDFLLRQETRHLNHAHVANFSFVPQSLFCTQGVPSRDPPRHPKHLRHQVCARAALAAAPSVPATAALGLLRAGGPAPAAAAAAARALLPAARTRHGERLRPRL
jgi:hypothetical protein